MGLDGNFFHMMLGAFTALFPIINPFSAAPIFLAITASDNPSKRQSQLRRACIYSLIILISTYIGGQFVMDFFNISIPVIRIAGGILIAQIGLKMLASQRAPFHSNEQEEEAIDKPDISLTPLAIPFLSGPGAIAVTLSMSSSDFIQSSAVILAIALVMLSTYLILKASEKIVPLLGYTGLDALTRLLGFLLLCVGIQFIVQGILSIIKDPLTWCVVKESASLLS